ncbi:site-specific integrase [Micromonospora sp. NPDC047753]|uniref:tyrosine-type recombinase/integrase n=1 Tax=Micromonospora sp. NPDC047753 TaxID=3154817 RepID=UPI0033DF17D2
MARAWIKPSADGPGHTCFWMDPDRRQRQKTFRRKVDAENFRTRKERELDTGTYLETERGAETVATLFERWATTRGLENSSVRQYRSMLNQAVRPYFKARTTGALKLADIQAWILWMRDTKKYQPQTIQTRFGYLSSALQWAVDNDELGRNPAKRAKLPGRRANVRRVVKEKIVVPTRVEIEALIAAFDPRYTAMAWLMAGCGLRVAEAMGLCRDQIDFRRGLLLVNRQITEDGESDSGKNAGLHLKMYTKHRDAESPGRAVPLPKIVAAVLRAHLKKFGAVAWQSSQGQVHLLFPNHSRTGLLYQYYFRNQIWQPALMESKVSFTKTHALRHFFASSMLGKGCRSPTSRSGWATAIPRSLTSTTATSCPKRPNAAEPPSTPQWPPPQTNKAAVQTDQPAAVTSMRDPQDHGGQPATATRTQQDLPIHKRGAGPPSDRSTR